MLRMNQVHVIRHKVLVEGQSQRQTAEEMSVSRNTVKKYIHPERRPRTGRPVFRAGLCTQGDVDTW